MKNKFNLIPMTRKELADALGLNARTLYRKIATLNIPERERIVPKCIIEICSILNRDVQEIEDYLIKNHLIEKKDNVLD